MLFGNFAKLNRPSRNTVFVALIVIATMAIYNWLIVPQTAYLAAAQQYKSIADNFKNRSKVIDRTVKAKEKKLEQLQQQFAEFENMLFSPREAAEFFGNLQVVSEEMGCTVYSLNIIINEPQSQDNQSENTSGIAANSAALSVLGVYGDIVALVQSLQGRGQKVWIDSVEMQPLNHDSTQLRCDITITIYTIQDKEITLNG